MKRNLIIGLAIVAIVGGGLAAVKTLQIRKMIAMGKSASAPPETVATAVATEEKWADDLPAVGSVTPAQGVLLAPEIAGTVTKIAFESGAAVNQGDLLVRMDTSSEEARLRAAEAQVQLAKLTAERARQLLADKTISQSELDQAVATLEEAQARADEIRATVAKKTIRAPFNGRLGIRLVNLGEQLDVGKAIVSLQSLSPVYVDFSLPQQVLAVVQTGLVVTVTSDTYPDVVFTGELTAINPDLDVDLRTVRVRATFANTNELLRAGMFVNARISLPAARPVLAIPATAVLYAPYGDSVFVVEPEIKDGRTNLIVGQKFIRTGRTRGDFVSVETGLKAGERVVTSGIFKLRKGMAVVENNAVAPQPSETPTPPNS